MEAVSATKAQELSVLNFSPTRSSTTSTQTQLDVEFRATAASSLDTTRVEEVQFCNFGSGPTEAPEPSVLSPHCRSKFSISYRKMSRLCTSTTPHTHTHSHTHTYCISCHASHTVSHSQKGGGNVAIPCTYRTVLAIQFTDLIRV